MEAREPKVERGLYELFEISVILKGLDALLEIVVGIALFFVNIPNLVQSLVQTEIIEDPNDFIATHIQALAGTLSPQVQTYGALYLLAHGVIKVVVVIGLLRRSRWAYPAALAVFALFIAYQTIKFIGTHSIPLLLLDIFDILLVWLVYHEYRRMTREGGFRR